MDPQTQALLAQLPKTGESVSDWQRVTASRPTMDVVLLRELTQLKDVPDKFKKIMWAFMSQEDVWAKTNEQDRAISVELFLAAWDFYEYSQPEDITPEVQLWFINAMHKFRMRLSRTDEGFERLQENTTIAQTITPQHETKGPNWFRRAFSKFGL